MPDPKSAVEKNLCPSSLCELRHIFQLKQWDEDAAWFSHGFQCGTCVKNVCVNIPLGISVSCDSTVIFYKWKVLEVYWGTAIYAPRMFPFTVILIMATN